MDGSHGTKRGPYAATKERRERISAAVIEIVDESGLVAVTIAAVAQRSAMSERTVIYHFPTKDDLLVAALELLDDRAAANTIDAGEFDLEQIRAMADSLRSNERRLQLFLVLKGYSAMPENPANEYFRRRTERLLELYTSLLRQGQAVGQVHREVDIRASAIQFSALWDGLTGLAIFDQEMDAGQLLVDGFRRLTGANQP